MYPGKQDGRKYPFHFFFFCLFFEHITYFLHHFAFLFFAIGSCF